MRKLAFLVAVVGAVSAAQAQAYDSITGGSFFTSGSSPRTSFADDFTTDASTSGLLQDMTFGISLASGTDFTAQIKFYSSWNGLATGTTSVVGSVMGGFTTNVTGLTAGGWLISVGGLVGQGINLAAGTTYAWSMEFFDLNTTTRVAANRVTPFFNGNAVLNKGSNNDIQYVRDGAVALDGIYNGGELRNVAAPFAMAGTFNVVPEPASMLAMGAGIAALIAKRRKK